MTKFAFLYAGAVAVAMLPAAAQSSQHQGQSSGDHGEMSSQSGQQTGQQGGSQMGRGGPALDVALGFVREADVVGAENEEIGDVVDIVRPSGDGQGLNVVVNVESGWFDAGETQIVAPLDRFTITEEGYLRLDGAAEDTIEEYEEYAEGDWEVIGEEYETYEGVYDEFDWEW